MEICLACDVYGTLVDPRAIAHALEPLIGPLAPAFAEQWRQKQLEYSFRRALMGNYRDFSACTAQAFDYTCRNHRIQMSAQERQLLLAGYRELPLYDDVLSGLTALQEMGLRLFAFSNGTQSDLNALLQHAQIDQYFESVISLEHIQTYKPAPSAYAYFHRSAQTTNTACWLVSSNSFDVIGAISSGIAGLWLQRSTQIVFDPWEIQPTATISKFTDLIHFFEEKRW